MVGDEGGGRPVVIGLVEMVIALAAQLSDSTYGSVYKQLQAWFDEASRLSPSDRLAAGSFGE
ncbi:hypothetical protein [Nocardia sp. BMG51109]|uniref:hypothetical protein n=1 Tax=Nocardia sp. BMG51109 TaxID=1056816 RepID=UPI0012EB2C32|nr:hypothetical protein [Nocardia sp. BMG51109]